MRFTFVGTGIICAVLLAILACGGDDVDANVQAEWAECVGRLDDDAGFLPDREFYDFTVRQEFMDRCDPGEQGLTNLWISCILEEFAKLSPEIAASVEGSFDVAEECDGEMVRASKGAEWIECIAAIDSDPSILPRHEFVDFTQRNEYRTSCPAGEGLTNLWITCIGEELDRSNPDLEITIDQEFDVADDCAAKVSEPNEQAEWVECIVALDADPLFFLDKPTITFDDREVYIDKCDPNGNGLNNLWITCIYDEFSDEIITTEESISVAETCAKNLE